MPPDGVLLSSFFALAQFNDSLVYAQEPGLSSDKYAAPRMISLAGVTVTENPGTVPGVVHAIRVVSPTKSFIRGAPSLAEKLLWLQRFDEVVADFAKTAPAAARAGGGTSGAGGVRAPVFCPIAPVWVRSPPPPTMRTVVDLRPRDTTRRSPTPA